VLDGDHEFGEWNVLDIGIMFWVIRYEVVNVVILSLSSLQLYAYVETYIAPPAEAEPTDVVGN
jgi:hypothetical protein